MWFRIKTLVKRSEDAELGPNDEGNRIFSQGYYQGCLTRNLSIFQSRYCYSVALRLYGGLGLDFSVLLDIDLKHMRLVCVCIYKFLWKIVFLVCVNI